MKFLIEISELIGGSSDNGLYVYDLNRRELILKLEAHENDINTVCYGEVNNNNLILTGSDDCLCKVWDRRQLGINKKPVGVLIGHAQGITHISAKGDGIYFISNGKDQCTKLWDIRKMEDGSKAGNFSGISHDYRYGIPPRLSQSKDDSLLTLRGHQITRTLIRCYFSPLHSTGQKYIYTGSADGAVYIYDAVSGTKISKLHGHRDIIRDLSWHPYQPNLVSTSWDGSIKQWNHESDD